MPCLPLRATSASPCITRTVSPQPAEHNVQTLGFNTAIPGIRFSSGMKRMSCLSGAPAGIERCSYTCERRDLDEVTPFHNRVSCSLVVAGRAIDRCLLLFMAVDAITHVQIHSSFRRCLLSHIAMAGGAIYSGANMRRMIEVAHAPNRCSCIPAPRESLRLEPDMPRFS